MLQSSSAINISDTIPVGPAVIPFFIILRAFKISSLLISSQGSSTFSQVVALSHVFSSFSSFFHILSPFFLHLIIFYQHFSICIFHTIYSYYILPGFCHLSHMPSPALLGAHDRTIAEQSAECCTIYQLMQYWAIRQKCSVHKLVKMCTTYTVTLKCFFFCYACL